MLSDCEKEILKRILNGEQIQIPCAHSDHAELIRAGLHAWAIKVTTEPLEINILGEQPKMEVWIRKLPGGRPKTWGCSCGFQGTEEEINKHICRLKKFGTKR